MKKILSILLLSITVAIANAQEVVNANSQDVMRSNGKIYVVVAVVLIILCGLFFYVWKLDRKINKLEKGD